MSNRLRGLSIASKLWGMIFMALVALMVIGTVAVLSTGEIKDLGESLYAGSSANAKLNSVVTLDVERVLGETRSAPAELDLKQLQVKRDHVQALITELKERLDRTTSGKAPDSIKASAGKIRTHIATFELASKKVFDATANFAQQDAIAALTTDVAPVAAALKDALQEMNQAEEANAAVQVAAIERQAGAVTWIVMAVVLLLVLGLAGLSYVVVSRGVSRPLAAMNGTMIKLATGETNIDIPYASRSDEIGEMARAVGVFKSNMVKADAQAAEQKKEQSKKEARVKAIEAHIIEFDKAVSDVLHLVAASTKQLQATAQSMSATAERTSDQATAVAAASEEASSNVQTVASAAEELSSSISEISRQVSESARIAGEANAQATTTNTQIQGMAEAAQKIGDVVKLITDIASQTNLLALNATIEAARAGELGKGFAVVASEVKSLANQTAKATEEISTKITEMQTATGQSVQAVQTIGETIGRINEIATAIASAVEEQGAATKEIARNVEQASAGTSEVSANISGVTQAASETGTAASQVLNAASELSKQSEKLQTQVDGFIAKIRAA